MREALREFQRDFARQEPGAVLDGRDIGTVVLPDADVKIFVIADAEVRAKRRYLELRGRGEPVSYEAVLDAIRQRDERDQNREASPMIAATDAITLDTTHLDAEQAFQRALELIGTKSA